MPRYDSCTIMPASAAVPLTEAARAIVATDELSPTARRTCAA